MFLGLHVRFEAGAAGGVTWPGHNNDELGMALSAELDCGC